MIIIEILFGAELPSLFVNHYPADRYPNCVILLTTRSGEFVPWCGICNTACLVLFIFKRRYNWVCFFCLTGIAIVMSLVVIFVRFFAIFCTIRPLFRAETRGSPVSIFG